MGIDKDQLIKAFGYDGEMTSSTKIAHKDEINNNEDNKIINNNNNNLASIESNVKDNNNLERSENNEERQLKKVPLIEESNKKEINNEEINKEEINKEEINKEEINKEESIKNINTINTINNITDATTNNISNTNTVSNNFKKLPSIEEERQEEAQFSEESQLLSLLHVFVKNIESHGITKEVINQKIEDICKLFENKEEATKEEFIEPFVKMFIETMEITKEKDIEVINSFLNDFVDSLNGETELFFNGLIEVFDNIKDYSRVFKDYELSFELNKYKDQLLDSLRKNDVNNNHLITFDIFRKIVQDLSIVLEDESMEYLIYKMKKNVPENNSIFDLNYEIIENLLEKNEIGDLLVKIKNLLNKNNINIDNECQEFLNTVEYQDLKFLIIKRDDYFNVLSKLNISMNDELKNGIYELYKIEIENDRNDPQYWMEYDKIKSDLE